MNDIYQCIQMNTIENITNDINLYSYESKKLVKTNNSHCKLHNPNSFTSDMINTFNTDTYYNITNNKNNINNNINKHDLIKCSNDTLESNKLNPILAIASHQWFDRLFQSNTYTGNNYHHQLNHNNPRSYNHDHQQLCNLNFDSSHDLFENTHLNSSYSECCQTSEDNLLTTQTVINNLELTRFSEMHYCDKSINDNTDGDNSNSNEINETNSKVNMCTEIDFNNSTKYGFNSVEEKSPINSNQLKSHSSCLDYQNEVDYDKHQFTNYSNYLTEFDKNELTKMENKQHLLTSDEKDSNNAITCSNDSSNFCSNRLRNKLTSEPSDNTKKSHFYFDEEYKTKNINGNHRLNQTITADKSYTASFQSKENNDACLNSMPKNNNNFRLYNLRSSTTPLRKSSSTSQHQTNPQKMLNNEIITTTSLLEWHLTPESGIIEKIKPDNNSNEQLLLNYKSQSSNQSSDSMYNDSSCVNDASKSSNKNSNYEKLISQTSDHSPPLSYSSQSTEHLNEDSFRSSHQHLHSQSHLVEKLHSNFNNDCTWKANNQHSDFLSFDNEINYIKNHWNSSHNLLMNKLRFNSNLTTQTTALPVVINSSNNEVNSNEQNTSFDSMIPCISHNFLTNFTRTPYDPTHSNSMHDNLYGLSSSHLNTNGSLMGNFSNTSLFNIDDSNHHVSPPTNNHNKLDDEYDRTEHCLGTYNHSHHHDHHHTSHNQFMTMNNCGNCDYNLNFQNVVTSVTSTTTTNFKTSLNCYLLPPINGFNVNSVDTNQSQLTDGGVSSNFKTRLNSSSGYSSQNFPHSTILGCNHSNASFYRHPVELDYNPRELEAFSELFKQRRIKLGVTQADVGKALGNLKISGVGSLSQSTICRFESLTLSHNNMVALKPVLQAWLEEAEAEASTRLNHPSIYDLEEERRRKRTSITDSEKRSLEAFFSIQPRPSSEKIAQIAEKLNLKKNVVRVWFCNQRQKQKRMKFSTLGMLHHSVTRT